MATRNVVVTDNPANLVTTHSLVVGTEYALQNIDPSAVIFIRTAAVKLVFDSIDGGAETNI